MEVRSLAPGLRTDLRYATTNNFTGRRLYPSDRCYLRRPVARRLAAAQAELERQGLGLKVWDGYRPLSVQRQLWLLVPDERYVASPSKGSRHNRGAAVDVTLVRKDGSELPMPTGFDDFSPKAHRDCQDLPAEAIRHRELLERIMAKHGFLGLRTEWWHFDDAEWPRYDLLDLPAP